MDTMPPATAGGWSSLRAWLCSLGANLDAVDVSDCGGGLGHGVFARRDVAEGEVVFSVPQKAMLALREGCADPLDEALAAAAVSTGREGPSSSSTVGVAEATATPPVLRLVLRLCRARACEDDAFHAYAVSLPDVAPDLPSWDSGLVRLASSSTCLGSLLQAEDHALAQWEDLVSQAASLKPAAFSPREAYSRGCMAWAHGMVKSRVFPSFFAAAGGGESSPAGCLVPLLDLLNHRQDADVTVRTRAGMLEFLADGPVAAGDQIWNCYGAKSNTELLLSHGFAVPGNPEDCIKVSLAVGAGASGPTHDSSSVVPLRLTRAQPLPPELLSALRGCDGPPRDILMLSLLQNAARSGKEAKQCLEEMDRVQDPSLREQCLSLKAFLEGQMDVSEAVLGALHDAGCLDARKRPRRRVAGAAPKKQKRQRQSTAAASSSVGAE